MLESHDGLTLVDGGWALDASRALLERSLIDVGLAVGDIRRFLVTHAHRDHYTQAVVLRRETGAEVWIGRDEQPAFDRIRRRTPDDSAQVPLLRAAGAVDLARELGRVQGRRRVEPVEWELPTDGWTTSRWSGWAIVS